MIEVMIVLCIFAVLAMMVIPSTLPIRARGQIQEAVGIADKLKPSIQAIYEVSQKFPENNEEAGLPEPQQLIGNFVETITLEKGALHLGLGNKIIGPLEGKTLTIQPIAVKDSPNSPISWVCGHSKVPEGMQAMGDNKTDIEPKYLPISCR